MEDDVWVCIVNYGVNMGVGAPMVMVSGAVHADKPGVYWYYCSWFCHAMHMETKVHASFQPKSV